MIYFNFDELEVRKEENRQLRQLVHKLVEENEKLTEENERLKRIIRIFAGEEE
jgi:regulator of replication initiation timing